MCNPARVRARPQHFYPLTARHIASVDHNFFSTFETFQRLLNICRLAHKFNTLTAYSSTGESGF